MIRIFKGVNSVIVCFWLLSIFATAQAQFSITSVKPTAGVIGDDLEIVLEGSGFASDMRVFATLDGGNQRSIIGSIQMPDYPEDVFLDKSNDRAYVACGLNGLQIVDASDVNALAIMGKIDTPGEAHDVAVIGDYAVVADGDEGIQIIDVHDPGNPAVVKAIATTGKAVAISISVSHAYLAEESSGVEVYDMATPSDPVKVATIGLQGPARDVFASGNILCVADGQAGLQIVDIADPTNPRLTQTVDLEGAGASGVSITGEMVFVTAGDLWIFNISKPDDPKLIKKIETSGRSSKVSSAGNKAVVSNQYLGMEIIDFTDSSQPYLYGDIMASGYVSGVFVQGDRVLATNYRAGLQIIDVAKSVPSDGVGRLDTPGSCSQVAVMDSDIACVGDSGVLRVIDIHDPFSPVELGHVKLGNIQDIAASGKIAYIADWTMGLAVVDVSDPASPFIIGSSDVEGLAFGVDVVDDLAYVATSGGNGIEIFDIGNSDNIRLVGALSGYYSDGLVVGNKVVVQGDFAYMTGSGPIGWLGYQSGLMVIDVSDPSSPQFAGIAGFGDDQNILSWGLAVKNNIAYAAYANAGNGGLKIIHAGTPSNPVEIAEIEFSGEPWDVAVSKNMAYVANSNNGIEIIDIRSPTSPLKINTMKTPGMPFAIDAMGEKLYVGSVAAGLIIAPEALELHRLSFNTDNKAEFVFPSPDSAGHYSLMGAAGGEKTTMEGAVTFLNEPLNTKVVIVAGGSANDENWAIIQMSAEQAYRSLSYQGFTDDAIIYLSSENGDNPLVDDWAGKNELKDHLDQIKNMPDVRDLILFMVDHGDRGVFKISLDELLSAETLDAWLDDVQNTLIGEVIVIYDACYSGSFIPLLLPPEGKTRIVMTSSGPDSRSSLKKEMGLSFSFQLWSFIHEGTLLYDAYEYAANFIEKAEDVNAQLDANGDGMINEEDGSMSDVRIGRRMISASRRPIVQYVSDDQTLDGQTSADFSVWGVIAPDGVQDIWANIQPPEKTGAASANIDLQGPDQDGVYHGDYDNFICQGDYTIKVFVQAKEKPPAISEPITITQNQGVSCGKGDLDGDGDIHVADAIIALKILSGATIGNFLQEADANGNQRVDMAEAVYILQTIARGR